MAKAIKNVSETYWIRCPFRVSVIKKEVVASNSEYNIGEILSTIIQFQTVDVGVRKYSFLSVSGSAARYVGLGKKVLTNISCMVSVNEISKNK